MIKMAVNLQKLYSRVNEALTKLFDESGVRRSFTVPYVEQEPMAQHVSTVGKVALRNGGLTKNLVTTMHHSGGKGWGTGDGETVGHPAHNLKTTVVPKDDENAKAVIDSAQKYLNAIGSFVGEKEPAIQTANSQLSIVKKTNGAGMNLLDFGTLIQQVLHGPTQIIARAHHNAKPEGGAANPGLLPPRHGIGQTQANPAVPPQANSAVSPNAAVSTPTETAPTPATAAPQSETANV
jgi:hypothetical protein